MFVNENEINKKFRPQIKGTLKNIENAEKILSSIEIPKDFRYYTELKNMEKSFNEIKADIKLLNKNVDKFINNINIVENKNKKIVDSLMNIGSETKISKTSNKSLLGTTLNLGYKISETQKQIGEGTTKLVKKYVEYNENRRKMQIETGAKVVSKVGSAIKNTASAGAKFVKGFTSKTRDICRTTMKSIGAKISSVFTTVNNKIIKPVINIGKTVVATVTNIFTSIIEGISKFIEALVNCLAIIGSIICTPITAAYDEIKNLITENDDDGTATSEMWKNTMSFVSTDYVGNAFSSFYKGTAVGKWLDKNAVECCKSDGIVCKVGEGIGYIAGIVALTLATAGIGTAAEGAAGAVSAGSSISSSLIGTTYAGAAGVGKGAQENWNKRKEESWQGIEEKYQKGEISNEQYESYKKVRLMTKEQWENVELNYKNGKISQKEFEQMKAIREMQNDWRTLENGAKGISAGVATGFWEGIQWYLGGKLAGKTILKGGSASANSALRVGIDSGFNALDTPFRSVIEATTSDESLKEAWQNQGGWSSMVSNLAIGLLGSIGGEFADRTKIKNGLAVESNNVEIESVEKIKGKVKDTKNIELKTTEDVIKFSLEQNGKKATKENVNKIMKEIENGDYSSITNKNYLREELEKSLKSKQEEYLMSKINIKEITTLENAIDLSIKEKGLKITDELRKKYRNELKNEHYDIITRKGNSRKFVIEYMNKEIKNIDDAIELTMMSAGKTSKDLKKYNLICEQLAEGNLNCITNDNGARAVVENIYNLKAKKYLDLKTNDLIFKEYGGLSFDAELELMPILEACSKACCDNQENFISYILKSDISKEAKEEIKNLSKYNSWMNRLTVDEAAAAYSYTVGSGPFNIYLGQNKFEKHDYRLDINTEEKLKDKILKLDRALEKGQILKKNKVFYRGSKYEHLKAMGLPDNFEELSKMEGKTIPWNSYISTGVSKEGSFDQPIEFKFKCPAGKKYGAYINEISHYWNAEIEYEFLIKSGAQVRLDKITEKEGKTFIEATILGFKGEN